MWVGAEKNIHCIVGFLIDSSMKQTFAIGSVCPYKTYY